MRPIFFDFTSIIGLPIGNPEIRKLFEFCEERPQPTERYDELEGRYYLQFPRSGLSLLLTGSDLVETVHLHPHHGDGHGAYFAELPFALTADTTQAEARDLFGFPTVYGGPVAPVGSSESAVYWDRWDYECHTFHLEYPESRDGIRLITIGTPPELGGDECDDA